MVLKPLPSTSPFWYSNNLVKGIFILARSLYFNLYLLVLSHFKLLQSTAHILTQQLSGDKMTLTQKEKEEKLLWKKNRS